jgi:hypothetical protein
MQSLHLTNTNDTWSYIWGTKNYSSVKAYMHMLAYDLVHPTLKWIWKTKCQTKHKVFFWLLLQDKLNTRGMLRRRNMYLDSYACEMCIQQREESLRHLFFRCSFAKKLLAADWDRHSSLVTSKESSQKNQNNDRPTFYHGHNHHHVLEHLVKKKCMDF